MMMLFMALAVAGVGQCGLCHPEERVAHEASIHIHEGVGCTDCHGGDPEAVTVEEAHRGSFRRSLTRFQIPGLCADCHSDTDRMRPYNLSSEQYALYQTSQHGIALSKGDSRVAVCTDCHGVHDTLASSDPRSRAFARNVPATCGTCHGNRQLMSEYGIDAGVYQEYLASRHAEELLRNNNLNAPDCSRCHGVHGATPPGVGDIDKVCGNCHTAAREYYLQGPHSDRLREAELPECVSCHGSHQVLTVARDDTAANCLSCHSDGSEPVAVGRKVDVLVERATEELERAQAQIEEARQVPLYVEDYEARLQEARTYLLEAEPAVHSVRLEDVERLTGSARSLGEEIQSEIQGEFSDLSFRRIGLVIFWFYLILTIAILYRFRRNVLAQKT